MNKSSTDSIILEKKEQEKVRSVFNASDWVFKMSVKVLVLGHKDWGWSSVPSELFLTALSKKDPPQCEILGTPNQKIRAEEACWMRCKISSRNCKEIQLPSGETLRQ